MTKEKVLIIFLIIIGLVITVFLGGKIVKEGFTSNSVTFIAVPMADPNSPQATVVYPNNNMNSLNFTLNNQTVQYTLTNTSTTTPLTYTYQGSDGTTAKLIIPPSTNTGPDQNVKQMFVITNTTGKITPYGSTTTFVDPSSSSSTSTTPASSSTTSSSTTTTPSSQTNTNFDNYNHYSGTSSTLTNDRTFYGPNGGTAVITTNSDGTQIIKVTLSSSDNPIVFAPSNFNISGETFYGPNGGIATIATDSNGNKVIIIKNNYGVFIYKTQNPDQLNNQNDISSTQYFGSTGYTTYPYQSQAYTGSGSQSSSALSDISNSISSAIGSLNQPASSSSSAYNSVLPQGIPRSQIPPGQEDLYILKSEVVPPVCPACPAAASCPRQEPCAPCPPCGRCPEPSFECKKVPNYNAINNQYLPAPFVNSFSSFGR